jgi:short-subunit dehydrogenase
MKQPRTAVLTGASRGIGPYIARDLLRAGMDVLLVARSEAELAKVAQELRTPDRTVAIAPIDLGHPDAAEQVATTARRALGHVDVLVNNAAVELQRRFHTLTADEIDNVVRVDLVAPMLLAHALLPQMLAEGRGHIVNVSSIAGRVGFPFSEAYAASKDGLIAFSRVLRNDYRRCGVSASAIVLGAVKDAGLGQRTIDAFGIKTNTALMVKPEYVAKAVVRAITKDKAEIVVMPGPGRFLKSLMDLFPGFGAAMNRASGAEKTMSVVADFRETAANERSIGHIREPLDVLSANHHHQLRKDAP